MNTKQKQTILSALDWLIKSIQMELDEAKIQRIIDNRTKELAEAKQAREYVSSISTQD